ncbi:MAG: GNAT family N-acetyltransferase [Theionarchaea archaeon]|nr:GNAT family N-acetyltransferase [Theionarchaea archaeon]
MQIKNNPDLNLVSLKEMKIPLDRIIDDFIQKAEGHLGEDVYDMVEPLRESIHEKAVDGWVVCDQEKALGFIVLTLQEERGRIPFIHVLSKHENEGLSSLLIIKAVEELRKGGAHMINSEVLAVVDREHILKTFEELGFQIVKRMIMSTILSDVSEPLIPPGYSVISWDDTYLEGVAKLIYDANVGKVDQQIYPVMKTVEGTTQLVKGIIAGEAGSFDREASLILLREGETCGAILFAQSTAHQGFIAEMAIAGHQQGKGLGTVLMAKSFFIASHQGIKTVRLGATEENQSAVRLYQKFRFIPEQHFFAYVWEG